jgi:uncharacterized protein YqfB (UPF0267 family)
LFIENEVIKVAFISESEFKGNPVISIKRAEEDRYGITMGVSKAKLVIENIEAIKAFVAKNDKSEAQGN